MTNRGVLIIATFYFYFSAFAAQPQIEREMQPPWLLNLPGWAKVIRPFREPLSILTSTPSNDAFIDQVASYSRGNFSMAIDLEDVDAMEHFFYGITNGIALELGAEDGTNKTHSMTHTFETYFNWRRILIEGNPKFREDLKKNNPNAVTASIAISNSFKTQTPYSPVKDTGGLIENMTPAFVKYYHHYLLNISTPILNSEENIDVENLKDNSTSIKVSCVPLQHLFDLLKVRHVNFFLLDVEGSEYQILDSIDWRKQSFDVLVVETSIFPYRPKLYTENIIRLMESKGYEFVVQITRNLWFRHTQFTPRAKPGQAPNCFSSVEWAYRRQKCPRPRNDYDSEHIKYRNFYEQALEPISVHRTEKKFYSELSPTTFRSNGTSSSPIHTITVIIAFAFFLVSIVAVTCRRRNMIRRLSLYRLHITL